MTSRYKPISSIPVYSQNCVACQNGLTFEILTVNSGNEYFKKSISNVILITEEVITATLNVISKLLQSCSDHFFSGQDNFVCGQIHPFFSG